MHSTKREEHSITVPSEEEDTNSTKNWERKSCWSKKTKQSQQGNGIRVESFDRGKDGVTSLTIESNFNRDKRQY